MKKRILSLLLTLLTLVMLVGMIPATSLTAFAANTDVPFTSDSKAAPGSSMTVDLDALAEQDEAFMEAYFNEDFTITWYLNGTKVTTNIGGSFGEAINLTDADAGKSLYVTIEADGNTYTSKTFTVETPPDVYVGGVGMANGTYLANNATVTRPDKPSVGHAYYKDGVLTLNYYNCRGTGYEIGNNSQTLIYAPRALKIVLEGENILTQTTENNLGIYFAEGGTISGSGSLAISGPCTYGIHVETGDFTCYADYVSILDCAHGVNVKTGDVWISGGLLDVTVQRNAVAARQGSVTVTDGELTAKSTNGSSVNRAINAANGFSVANHLTVLAAEAYDGVPGAYDEANIKNYDLIMVKNYPILLGVKTTGGMVGESESGGSIYFDSCESVFSRECSEETT